MSASSLEVFLESSPSLASTLSGAERAARSSSPVLILGEAGSGRSTLARALHDASRRSAGALVEVDPGAIPSTLFESEFFGYEAGAFTGATRATAGRVARAESGTLLLDHVEELPLTAQPKLLRLLAEQRYAPLGGAERGADVRFLAIGTHELPERMRRGAFREDLYYRLEVLAFRLPPLRERREDLPYLIEAILTDLGERYERPGCRLTPRARAWIREYSWPGNLRQLRNVLERVVILTETGELDPLPPEDLSGPRPRSLVELEKEEIRKTLAYTRGHQGEAARLLGISRKSLWEKRRRYDIP